MIRVITSIASLLLAGSVPVAPAHADDTETINAPCVVDAYLRAHEATMQRRAGPESVEAVMNLLHEKVVYEHPRVGIKIESASGYRQGLSAFLGATDEGRYEVEEYMVNGDTVAISMNRIFKVEAEGEWRERRVSQMTIFEVRDGKISRIVDYW